jgi:hypothetical protein
MRFRLSRIMAGAALLAAMPQLPVFGAQESGIVIKVNQSADVGRDGTQYGLRDNSPIFMGDVIKTDRVGAVQIRLSDDTRLVVGPNAVRGAFRVITGGSPKEAYTINTPTATIGVRGTRFDFSIDASGTNLAVFEGAADMCQLANRNICERAISDCSVAVSAPQTQIRRIQDNDERIKALTELFPFVVDQRRLEPAFQVDSGDCNIPASAIRAARITAALDKRDSRPPPDQIDTVITGSIPPPGEGPPPPPPPPPEVPPPCGPFSTSC